MNTMTRTDIHRPSAVEFDPADYVVLGFADFHERDGFRPVQVISRMVDEGWSFSKAPHGSGQCSHCGAHLRYAALMGHTATKTLLYVGETCLDNRFGGTAAEFQQMRKAAAAKAEQSRREGKSSAFYAENPDLVYMTYAHNIGVVGGTLEWTLGWSGETTYDTEAEAQAAFDALPAWQREQGRGYEPQSQYKWGTTWTERTRMGDKINTLQDMAHKVERYGEISDKAADYARKILVWVSEAEEKMVSREAAKAAQVEAGGVVTAGRQVLTGEVTKAQYKSNDFGTTLKITVVLENGARVWGSCPRQIEDSLENYDEQALVGKTVRFTATVETSDDVTFGFFKRPAKGEVL